MYKKCFPPCWAPQAGVIRCACLFFSLPDPLSPVSVSGSPSAAPTPALLHHHSATCVFVWKPAAWAPGAAVNAFLLLLFNTFLLYSCRVAGLLHPQAGRAGFRLSTPNAGRPQAAGPGPTSGSAPASPPRLPAARNSSSVSAAMRPGASSRSSSRSSPATQAGSEP